MPASSRQGKWLELYSCRPMTTLSPGPAGPNWAATRPAAADTEGISVAGKCRRASRMSSPRSTGTPSAMTPRYWIMAEAVRPAAVRGHVVRCGSPGVSSGRDEVVPITAGQRLQHAVGGTNRRTARRVARRPARLTCAAGHVPAAILQYFQLRWRGDTMKAVPMSLRGYQRSWLSVDLIAGATLAAVAIPETMGYTSIAQTPVVTGLYTVIFPDARVRPAGLVPPARRGRGLGDGGHPRRRAGGARDRRAEPRTPRSGWPGAASSRWSAGFSWSSHSC